MASAAAWLLTAQRPDGTFENLWYRDHTSGTAVVVAALSRVGHARHDVVRRAAGWLRDTQLPDGSWGPGDGTAGSVEETGWAVQGLLATGDPGTPTRSTGGSAGCWPRSGRTAAGHPPGSATTSVTTCATPTR